MEQQGVEYNNICNDNSEVYADILSGNENNISESDESDIIISRKVLPIESNSEKSDSDDELNNVTFTLWSESDIDMDINEFLGNDGIKVFPKDSEIIGDTVDLFIGNDFFELLVKETNRYHLQNVNKYKSTKKIKQWEDTTIDEMKKFLALNILMGQVNRAT
ncbi:piggyBac transposable element-derived protein 4-like [Ctenocephalides felis]|uniref:piggyBac transposable element-derived protein 4-like n=1 Tax=Ctenocephalides felis TaxID=7515 RepID=UPI000E6E44BA|nr:piggyBac transposable element-derived protein 4-like [Ctenocephalides felis]